jgi:flagellar motor switch protein FliN
MMERNRWMSALADTLAEIAGERPEIATVPEEDGPEGSAAGEDLVWYRLTAEEALWIGADENAWSELGGNGAAIAQQPPDDLPRTFCELRFAGRSPITVSVATGPAVIPREPMPARPVRTGTRGTLNLLLDVELPITVAFGKARVPFQDLLRFEIGSVVELDRASDDPVDVLVNDTPIARGEVVNVNGRYGIRILEITKHEVGANDYA